MKTIGRALFVVAAAALVATAAIYASDAYARQQAASNPSSGGCGDSCATAGCAAAKPATGGLPVTKPCSSTRMAQEAKRYEAEARAARACVAEARCDGDCATCEDPCPKAHIPAKTRVRSAAAAAPAVKDGKTAPADKAANAAPATTAATARCDGDCEHCGNPCANCRVKPAAGEASPVTPPAAKAGTKAPAPR